MYKPSNSMSPRTLNNIFAPRVTPYCLWKLVRFKIQKVYSVYNGAKTSGVNTEFEFRWCKVLTRFTDTKIFLTA